MLILAGSGRPRSRSLAVGALVAAQAPGAVLLDWSAYTPTRPLIPAPPLLAALSEHRSLLVAAPVYCGIPDAQVLAAFQALHEGPDGLATVQGRRLGIVGVSDGASGRECLQPLVSCAQSMGIWVDPELLLLCDDVFIEDELVDPLAVLQLSRLISRLLELEPQSV